MMKLNLFFMTFGLIFSETVAMAQACPILFREPKRLVCQTKMNYYGLPFSQKLIVNLKPTENYEDWAGKLDFDYPGVSNGDGTSNTLSAEVSIETHGNSPCQQWNDYSLDLTVLGYKFGNLGKSTQLVLKDGMSTPALKIDMDCSLE